MISHLVELLREGGVADPGPDELADILWLAREVLPSGPAPEPGEPAPDVTPVADDGIPVTDGEGAKPTPAVPGDTAREERPALRPYGQPGRDRTGTGAGAPVPVPAETALPQTLALTRSLKALTRKVPSDTAFELDEEATVTRLADENILVPVVRPEPARWLSLALVVDTSPSMALWHDEVREIQESLTRLGAFRDIRRWHLIPRDNGSAAELHPSPSAAPGARHPREVAAPGGRQLVLVLSDMVGAVWRGGAASRLLLEWSRRSQVAVAHLLPAALWRRGAVVPRPALVHIPEPGMPNSQWKTAFPGARRTPGAHPPLAVPVLELEPGSLRAWAELTAGSGRRISTAALPLPLPQPQRPARHVGSYEPVAPAPEEAIHRFRRSSSPASWRLAGYLSALSTVTVPVARLVQRSMLPGSSRGDLAEVLLGGLLRRSDAGSLRFTFPPEIGDALRGAQRDRDVHEVRALVREQVSARLETRYGSPRTFTGVLTGVAEAEATAEATGEAFATPSSEAVETLGHGAAARGPAVWQVPPRNVAFVGREGALRMVHDNLFSYGVPALVSLIGAEGMGKTQIALEYLYRYRSRYDVVWWIPAEEPDDVALSYAELAGRLGVQGFGEDIEENARLALDALGTSDRWLIVLDDAREPEAVEGWLPEGPGHVLVTSRAPEWREVDPSIEVGVFARAEAVAYLSRRHPELTAEQAADLAEAAGDLPAVVDRTAAYLSLGLSPTDFLAVRDAPAGRVLLDLALDHLHASQPGAMRLLVLFARLAPSPIPAAWLDRIVGRPADDPSWPQTALRTLARLGFVRLGRRGTFQLSPLVPSILSLHAIEEGMFSVAPVLESLLIAVCPDRPDLPDHWPEWAIFTPHLVASDLRVAERPEGRKVLRETIRYLLESGQPREAATLASEVRTACAQVLGEDHPDSLACASLCSEALERLGEYANARKVAEDTLARSRRLLGDEHPVTLHVASCLSEALLDLGQYAEAERLQSDVIGRCRMILGENHLESIRTVIVYACILYCLGRYDTMRRHAEAALLWGRRFLEEDHPETLRAADVLGSALRGLGEYEEALRIHEDALDRCRRVLGETHPSTLRAAIYVSVTLHSLGQHSMARRLMEDAFTGLRRTLGEDHPDTLPAAHSLGTILFSLREHASAANLLRDTLDRSVRLLGTGHPQTKQTTQALATVLMATGRAREAHKLLNPKPPRKLRRRK
ncbi:tetratricopeptide repeat protein [Streptomyces sp. NA02950]|uniref:FxSxx-COOH system tetratricopeptide repeat protein n=1 Tax=Streptomyces sp. NA02950 TaxID=2742137 RepID=UPI001590836A|nr:FxSxx-COOH system tetratricopeptide repeat protein [Streptomyces sp. NA02950]QKV95281.1 tetratricopeptide repeat protein [Streptomyces sp. NA02950]